MQRLLCFVLLLWFGGGPKPRKGAGLAIPTRIQASRNFILEAMTFQGPTVSHKLAIDLSWGLPMPGDQGSFQESCTGFAMGYGLITFLQYQRMHWSLGNGNAINEQHVYSPAYIYDHIIAPGNCKERLLLDKVMLFLQKNGTVPWSASRYDPNVCSEPQNTPATLRVQISSYNKLFDHWNPGNRNTIDTMLIKDELNRQSPVVIGVMLDVSVQVDTYGDRSDPNKPFIWKTFTPPSTKDTPYHAMLCVGYNDTIKAFKVLNSWGTDYNNKGYLWISYSIFARVVLEAYHTDPLPPLTLSVHHLLSQLESERVAPYPIQQNAWPGQPANWILRPREKMHIAGFELQLLQADAVSQTAVLLLRDTASDNFVTATLRRGESRRFRYLTNGINFRLDTITVSAEGKTRATLNCHHISVTKS